MWKKKVSKHELKLVKTPVTAVRQPEEVQQELANSAVQAGNIQYALQSLPKQLNHLNKHMETLFTELQASEAFWAPKRAEAAAEKARYEAVATAPVPTEAVEGATNA